MNWTNSSSSPNIIETISDLFYTFVMPTVGLFGFTSSIICVIVFAQPALRGVTFQYLLVFSIANALTELTSMFIWLPRCGHFCTFGNIFLAKVFEHYLYSFILSTCTMFNLLCEICIGLDRLLLFSETLYHMWSTNRWLHATIKTVILLLSLAYGIVLTLRKQIVSTSSSQYALATTAFGASQTGSVLSIVLTVSRVFLVLPVLVVLNVAMIRSYNVYMARKHHLVVRKPIITVSQYTHSTISMSTRDSRIAFMYNKESKLTVMVTWMFALIILAYMPTSIMVVLSYILPNNSPTFSICLIVANTVQFATHIFDIVIYWTFNKKFKQTTKRLFLFKKTN